jgi:hypothetical protein
MAKKIKEKEITDDLLGGNVAEVEVKLPEVKAVIKDAKKEKVFLGYHPTDGYEVWN